MPDSVEEFKRFALGSKSTPVTPDLPFPKLPAQIRTKFPDLEPYWNAWEKEIEFWVKSRQTV